MSLIFRRSCNLRNLIKVHQPRIRCCRYLSSETESSIQEKPINQINPDTLKKFQIFRDEEAVILDIEEERQRLGTQIDSVAEVHRSYYANLNLERGVTGVFEIEDLVEILKKDNAVNIFVCEVPKELKYVDYMCVVTGNSYRHMLGMASFVRKVYKLKRHPTDLIPKIEGENCKSWMAMDLGNIALHIFSKSAREKYDLESLWSFGPEFDNKSNQRDLISELFEQHSIYLPNEIHKAD